MNKISTNFFTRFVLFVLIFFLFDRCIGNLLLYLYLKKQTGTNGNMTYSITKTNEDILIFGSSRAVHHYDSRLIADSMNMTCFNCGRDGSTILYYDAVLHATLGRYQPKIIVLDVLPNDLNISDKSGHNAEGVASILLPYLQANKSLDSFVYNLNKEEVYKSKLSRLYVCNSLLFDCLAGLNSSWDVRHNANGFQPMTGSKVLSSLPRYQDYAATDKFATERLKDFIKILKDKNIHLFTVISPIYYAPFASSQSMDSTNHILKSYGLALWDYSQDTSYKHKEFFYDNFHMNALGAEKFSTEIASRIRKALN